MISDTLGLVWNFITLTDLPVGWATLALAVATFILAIFNWRVIGHMKEARKAEERPGLYVWSVPDYVDDIRHERVRLNVQNGGKGLVVEAKVECWLKVQAGDYAYLLYDGPISFAPSETRQVDCYRREESQTPPEEGDLVVRLRWRGTKPWWTQWQESKPRVIHVEWMQRHGTKFQSAPVTLADFGLI